MKKPSFKVSATNNEKILKVNDEVRNDIEVVNKKDEDEYINKKLYLAFYETIILDMKKSNFLQNNFDYKNFNSELLKLFNEYRNFENTDEFIDNIFILLNNCSGFLDRYKIEKILKSIFLLKE